MEWHNPIGFRRILGEMLCTVKIAFYQAYGALWDTGTKKCELCAIKTLSSNNDLSERPIYIEQFCLLTLWLACSAACYVTLEII